MREANSPPHWLVAHNKHSSVPSFSFLIQVEEGFNDSSIILDSLSPVSEAREHYEMREKNQWRKSTASAMRAITEEN